MSQDLTERIIQVERDIDVLRDHFQKLEGVFHTTLEVLEEKISNLTEEVKRCQIE